MVTCVATKVYVNDGLCTYVHVVIVYVHIL